MLSNCLKCRKNTESKNLKVVRDKNKRVMLLSKCAVCDSKKSKFIKQQEVSDLLSSIGIKTPLSKTPLVGPRLFSNKVSQIVNKLSLAGDEFMPEMHLIQPGVTYSACEPFTKNNEEIKKLKKQEIQNIFIKMIQIKLGFSMIWLMEILKIEIEDHLLMKYYAIKLLVLLKVLNMMVIDIDLLQSSINFLIKNLR